MPASFMQITDTLIYYTVKHYGFRISNPGMGDCLNFFISNSSCCNLTTVKALINHTRVVYEAYANITKLPVISLGKDLSGLLAGKNSSCINTNGSLSNLKLPGVNGQTSSTVNVSIASAYSTHDTYIASLVATEKALIASQSCLLCLATQDWDKFVLSNASVIYNSNYYNSLISTFTTALVNLVSPSMTINTYVTNFLTSNVNSTKCLALYSNYTARLSASLPCNSTATCTTLANTYFGQYLIPGVVWKLYRMYLNRSDSISPYEPPAFGDGLSGNITYS